MFVKETIIPAPYVNFLAESSCIHLTTSLVFHPIRFSNTSARGIGKSYTWTKKEHDRCHVPWVVIIQLKKSPGAIRLVPARGQRGLPGVVRCWLHGEVRLILP